MILIAVFLLVGVPCIWGALRAVVEVLDWRDDRAIHRRLSATLGRETYDGGELGARVEYAFKQSFRSAFRAMAWLLGIVAVIALLAWWWGGETVAWIVGILIVIALAASFLPD